FSDRGWGLPDWGRSLPIEWAPGLSLRVAVVALRMIGLALGCGGPAEPPVPRDAARIVSLATSTTEIHFGLGAADLAVRACAQRPFPPAAARVPHVGGYLAPSVEAVLGQRPDLVLVVPSPGNREAVRTIERAGVPVLVTADRTLEDLWGAIRTVSGALGVPERGAEMERDVRRGLDGVRARVDGLPPRRVLLVVGHRPLIVAGGGTR